MYIYLAIFIVVTPLVLTFGAILLNQAHLSGPPGFGSRLKTYLTTNVAKTGQAPVFPELQTPVFDRPADALYQDALDAIEKEGWTLEESNQEALRIKAIVVTPLWRFRDDVEIQIEQIKPEQSSLTITSSSRIGRGDLGANAGHILCLVKLLKEQS